MAGVTVGQPARRPTRCSVSPDWTTSPSWLTTSRSTRTMPHPGRIAVAQGRDPRADVQRVADLDRALELPLDADEHAPERARAGRARAGPAGWRARAVRGRCARRRARTSCARRRCAGRCSRRRARRRSRCRPRSPSGRATRTPRRRGDPRSEARAERPRGGRIACANDRGAILDARPATSAAGTPGPARGCTSPRLAQESRYAPRSQDIAAHGRCRRGRQGCRKWAGLGRAGGEDRRCPPWRPGR